MTSPIFVIGRNRSGTKWLSNSIANHPDVASVQRPGAGGILESNLIAYMPDVFGDLSLDENYYGFITCFSQTNFFKITGLPEDVLYRTRINDYHQFLRYIMDLFAQKRDAPFWLQKANTRDLEKLYASFPDALFIIIQRATESNIRSTLALKALNDKPRVRGEVIRELLGYCLARKVEMRFRDHRNVLVTSYGQLKANREQTLKEVCEFIGLSFHTSMLLDAYEKNTSFKDGISREEILSRSDSLAIRVVSPLLDLIPYPVWKLAYQIGRRIRGKNHHDRRFISLTFSLLAQEIARERLDDAPPFPLDAPTGIE